MKAKIILILTLLCLTVQAQKHEVRAVWLTTIGGIDWPYAKTAAAQYDGIVKSTCTEELFTTVVTLSFDAVSAISK